MEKLGVDMQDFWWKFKTGRCFKDYQIMVELGCGKLSDAYQEIIRYMDMYRNIAKEDINELRRKKWITKDTEKKANKIIELIGA